MINTSHQFWVSETWKNQLRKISETIVEKMQNKHGKIFGKFTTIFLLDFFTIFSEIFWKPFFKMSFKLYFQKIASCSQFFIIFLSSARSKGGGVKNTLSPLMEYAPDTKNTNFQQKLTWTAAGKNFFHFCVKVSYWIRVLC